MLDIRIVIGIFAILHSAYGACTECTAQYTSNKTDAGSDVTLKCNAVKDYVTCLEGKLNDGSCTLDATEAQVIQDDLPGTCDLSAACTCQKDFFKAVTTCSTAKARISCLKEKTEKACDGSTNVITLATATETYINGVGSCPLSGTTCECEVTYAKADISSNANKCTKTKAYVACLKGKTGTGCVATDTVMSLATAAGTTLTGIGETDCPLSGTTCECEVTYAKADISSNANKCTKTKEYVACLKGKTGTGCVATDTVMSLATAAGTTVTSIGETDCPLSGTTCECEVTYAKADISSNANKCTKTKEYVACLKGKTGTGCVATDTVMSLATAAGTTLTSIGETDCPLSGTTCECEVTYAKADISSDANMCTALKNEISCLVGKTENACNGSPNVSTLSGTVANEITGTSGCIVDENCQCEIDYVKTVTPANKCSKTKTLATCIQYEYDNGCGSERTRDKIGSYIQTTITDLGNTTCPVTETCQCQIDFAMASVTTASKCSSARGFSICIGNVNNATEFGCDGVTAQDFIKTNSSAIQKEFCSASGLPVASLILVLPAALFYLCN